MALTSPVQTRLLSAMHAQVPPVPLLSHPGLHRDSPQKTRLLIFSSDPLPVTSFPSQQWPFLSFQALSSKTTFNSFFLFFYSPTFSLQKILLLFKNIVWSNHLSTSPLHPSLSQLARASLADSETPRGLLPLPQHFSFCFQHCQNDHSDHITRVITSPGWPHQFPSAILCWRALGF